MLYRYIFREEIIEVDVNEETYRILRSLDRQEKYNNSKNYAVGFKKSFDDEIEMELELAIDCDPVDELEKMDREAWELFRNSFEKDRKKDMKSQLLKLLTKRQALAYFYSKYVKLSNVRIGKIMGIDESAVRKLIGKAEENLQKLGIEEIKPSDELRLLEAIFKPKSLMKR